MFEFGKKKNDTIKVVRNACYGGFMLPQQYLNHPKCKAKRAYDHSKEIRTDPILIAMIDPEKGLIIPSATDLVVEEIPANATDWAISEYDGYEEVVYVLDGKIHGLSDAS